MKADQFDSINRFYGLNIRRHQRVIYTGHNLPAKGTVIRADKSSMHIYVRLDGYRHTLKLHPTWQIEYLDEES